MEDYRQRSDFKTDDLVYQEFAEDIKNKSQGLPKACYEDFIYLLCGNDFSPEHEEKVKTMKTSKAGIILVIKEKEAFRNWLESRQT